MDSPGSAELIRITLRHQYRAALLMLRDAIENCPEDLWLKEDEHTHPYWRVAYHALYYTHLYVQPNEEAFHPWKLHREGFEETENGPPSADSEGSTPPDLIGNPYRKEEVLAYWSVCYDMVDGTVDEMDVLSSDSGFSWKKRSKLELQIESIRHLQHHTGQLLDRLPSAIFDHIQWVGGSLSGIPPTAG